jgi:predicted hydrolase (HD superfamily)
MYTDYIPISSLDKSLITADATTGFIIATAHSMPSKKIAAVDFEILIKKFNDPSFASRYKRNKIQLCIDIGIELEIFLELVLNTLKQISDKLNL